SVGSVRAEPKIVTFGTSRYGLNARNAARISLSAALVIFRSRRLIPSLASRAAVTRMSDSWSRSRRTAPTWSSNAMIWRSRAVLPVVARPALGGTFDSGSVMSVRYSLGSCAGAGANGVDEPHLGRRRRAGRAAGGTGRSHLRWSRSAGGAVGAGGP